MDPGKAPINNQNNYNADENTTATTDSEPATEAHVAVEKTAPHTQPENETRDNVSNSCKETSSTPASSRTETEDPQESRPHEEVLNPDVEATTVPTHGQAAQVGMEKRPAH